MNVLCRTEPCASVRRCWPSRVSLQRSGLGEWVTTHWAAIVTTVRVDEDDSDTDWADECFRELFIALNQAGNPPTAGWWTAMEQGDAADQVELLLSWPVGDPVPDDFSVPGVDVRTGTLPARTEAFVRMAVDEVPEDLLDGTSGGSLLHPAYIDFAEYLEEHGFEPRQVRQAATLNSEGSPVMMEIVATIES